MRAQGREIVMIGHRGHPEVEGTMVNFEEGGRGRHVPGETVADVARLQVKNPEALAYVTQTTLVRWTMRRPWSRLAAAVRSISPNQARGYLLPTQNRPRMRSSSWRRRSTCDRDRQSDELELQSTA